MALIFHRAVWVGALLLFLIAPASELASQEPRADLSEYKPSGDIKLPDRDKSDRWDQVLSPGQRFRYDIEWSFVRVGEATLEVESKPLDWNGQPAWHIIHTARTNRFADNFYKVRNRIESWLAADGSRSLHYQKVEREGKSLRDVTVDFDWATMQARYSNRGQSIDPIDIQPGTHDPVSVVYAARFRLPVEPGEMQLPVADGKRFMSIVIRILKKEWIEVPAGRFEAILVEPEVKELGGVFRKSKRAKIQIWFSADDRRLPLLVASKVAVGSFRAKLASWEEITAPLPPLTP